ncbi:hypothetical protein L3073_05990 [Ancylomarina sp. DW003]|nr:hypothetical protein [Ancylomarina sp. DW003]MDE5421751.1 hypothetical protein [Ancylomarina sp. DW003]
MNFIIIDKSLGATGQIDFLQEPFFEIQPDTKILQIGDGRETGCNRTDFFVEPFTYVGAFIAAPEGKDVKYYAFEVPVNMLPDDSEPHYLLYESTGLEVLRRKTDYDRFINPVFKISC